MRRTLSRHIGHRGAFLILVGTAWIVYGASITTASGHRHGLTLLLQVCSLAGWASLWILAGVIALACGPLRRPGRDTAGFVALIIPPMVWGTSNLVSWWPIGDDGRGWAGSLIWFIVALTVAIVASWPELPRGGGS